MDVSTLFSPDIDESIRSEYIKERGGKEVIVLNKENVISLLNDEKLIFLNITSGRTIAIEIGDSVCKLEIHFKNCSDIDLSISLSQFDLLSCVDTNFSSLKIVDTEIKRDIIIEGFNDLDPLKINSIIIKKSMFGYLRIANSNMDKISIKQAVLNSSVIKIENVVTTSFELFEVSGLKKVFLNEVEVFKGFLRENKITELELSGLFTSSSTLIVDSRIDNLIFHKFMNEGAVYISNINHVLQRTLTKNVLEASDSDLGKVHFINCDFFYWFFRFENSSVIDLLVTSSQFPKDADSEWERESEERLKNRQENERIVFGQFQKVYEANGDRIKSMYCHRRSLQAYIKGLKRKTDKTRRDRFEIFSLRMNGFSNQFEYSALAPLLWIGFFALTLFPIYLCLMGYTIEPWNERTVGRFFRLFTNIFEFISPIHKTAFLIDYDLNTVRTPTPWANIFDSVFRILFAYLIYQFVQAFRRYGKSKS